MIIKLTRLRNCKDFEMQSTTHPMNLPLNLRTADDRGFATPCHATESGPRDSRALANLVGRSPGSFAKKAKALMPLSPGKIFAANPLPSPWVPLGLPGGRLPGLAADTCINVRGQAVIEKEAQDFKPITKGLVTLHGGIRKKATQANKTLMRNCLSFFEIIAMH